MSALDESMIDVTLFADLGDGALVVDDERRCIAANAIALDLLDAPADGAVVGSVIELSSLLEWEAFLRQSAHDAVVVVTRRDGSRRSIRCLARARVDGARHLIVLRDVTAARAAAQLESSLAKLRAIVTDLPIAVVVFGVDDFRIELANAAYLAMVGRKEVVGLTLAELTPEVSPHSIHGYLTEVTREKQPRERREHALVLPSADGPVTHYFTNKFQPLFDDHGDVNQVMVTVLDVTQEVRARRLVAESAERLRVVLDELPVGANVRDATTGEVIINNRASTEILGVELRGRSTDESLNLFVARYPDGRLLGPDDHAFRRVMIGKKPVRNQIVILKRGGTHEEIVVRSSAALVDAPDAVPLVVSIVEDITDEYRLLAEQEQIARFAETFVGILAHDLRTPLHAITMGASMLAGKLAENAQEAKLVQRIDASARRMAEMIARLLDLTQTRLAGGVPVERSPVDLAAVVNAVLDEISIANPGVPFARAIPPRLTGDFDGARLAQVISNLVGNAVQHGDCSRPIVVGLEERDASALLTVRNHGSVIPGDALPEVFDPFRRRSARTRGKTSGLGLGLYITREVVRAHGGSIVATSTEADGTTFAVTLPRFSAKAEAQSAEPLLTSDRSR